MKRYAAGILVRDHKMLLGLRNVGRTFYPGVWDLIGGHCTVDESFTETMLRELMEEIGVIPKRYELLYCFLEAGVMEYQVFIVFEWEGEILNICPEEHSELAWFNFQETSALNLADHRYKDLFKMVEKKYGNM